MRGNCEGSSILCHAFHESKKVWVGIACHIWKEHKKALFTVTAVAIGFHIHGAIKERKFRQKWESVGKDVVVLHGFKRGKTCPNISPFVLKLETYLRMANIKYIFDDKQPLDPKKKKSPWISINGRAIGDSQLIMDYLGDKFNKDLSSHFSNEQKGVARAIEIMVDQHLFSTGNWWIWKDPDDRFLDVVNYPRWILKLMMAKFRKQIRQEMWWNGLGRHRDHEYIEMMHKDIKALSMFLGDKEFMMGDKPTEVDCAVFGHIGMLYYLLPGSPFERMVKEEFKNLSNYCLRMKDQFWADWDQLTSE